VTLLTQSSVPDVSDTSAKNATCDMIGLRAALQLKLRWPSTLSVRSTSVKTRGISIYRVEGARVLVFEEIKCSAGLTAKMVHPMMQRPPWARGRIDATMQLTRAEHNPMLQHEAHLNVRSLTPWKHEPTLQWSTMG